MRRFNSGEYGLQASRLGPRVNGYPGRIHTFLFTHLPLLWSSFQSGPPNYGPRMGSFSRSGFSPCPYDGESGTLLAARANILRCVLDRTIIPADEYKMLMRKIQLMLDKVPSPAPLRYVITVGPIRECSAVDTDVEVTWTQIQKLRRVGKSWRKLERVGESWPRARFEQNMHEMIGLFIRMTGLALVNLTSLTMQLGRNGYAMQ